LGTANLVPGTRLGPYRIEAQLGAGGMGEVFRAVDTRLGRTVAIKTCREQFSDRFNREARAISALNHPHICTLYDVGPDYLIMELVEGETLASRLKRGKIPIEQSIEYAAQIADGLAAAHAKGIIHRDLKPGNIMLTKSGVKVLDFGLAKSSLDDNSITASHVVMGTPAYMAPEQREGKPCDARTDVFTLGLVLQEMTGTTNKLPPQLAHIIERCLAPDPDSRWHAAADLKLELEWIAKRPPTNHATAPRAYSWIWITGVAAVILVALLGWVFFRPFAATDAPVRLNLSFEGLTGEGNPPAPSPDGEFFVFMAFDASGKRSLWIRPRESANARQIPGTEDALQPIWSADGRWIGFYAQAKLKKVSPSSGAPQTIADVPSISGGVASGAAWNQHGDTIFPLSNRGPLFRVRESGGAPRELTHLDSSRAENSHRFPVFLPDGRHFLFVARSSRRENNALYLASLDSDQTQRIMQVQSNVGYVSRGRSGFLLYVKDRTLQAQRFDGERLTGEPATVIENVEYGAPSLYGTFASSSDGRVVIFRPATAGPTQFKWYDRRGNALGTLGMPGEYVQPRISPDGTRLAYSGPDENGNRDIWYMEISRGVTARLIANPANDWWPAWSPDGRRIVFSSDRSGSSSNPSSSGPTYIKDSLDPASSEASLVGARGTPTDWSRDGHWIVLYGDGRSPTSGSIKVASAPGGLVFSFVESQFAVSSPRVSADSKWISYASNESGRYEIYVREFAGRPSTTSDMKIQVSTSGGDYPVWQSDAKELFFLAGDLKLYSVQTADFDRNGAAPQPVPLFTPCSDIVMAGLPMRATPWLHPYDVSPDGQRFLFNCNTLAPGRFDVMLNWAAR
jgi:eukaryotic-like serine/threonine-protein kinase